MFQTEPIHALQAFASEGMTGFMLAVSSLGYAYTLVPILVVITFGIDFRRGFLLIQIVLWNAALTEFLKAAFALPRPDAVDSTLLQPGDDQPEVAPFVSGGAPSFWAPLPAEVVAYYRGLGEFSYGFPSGHCSVTTSLWGSTALLFRERWLWALSLGLIALMPLSRMYLARHFLAGVLGGVGVGLLVIGVAWWLALGPAAGRVWGAIRGAASPSPEGTRFVLWVAPPLLVAFLPGLDMADVARLLGLNLGLWLLTRSGLPEGGDESRARFLRVVLAIALYALTERILGTGLERWLGKRALVDAVVEGASIFVLTWGTTMLSYRLGLYRRGARGEGILAHLQAR